MTSPRLKTAMALAIACAATLSAAPPVRADDLAKGVPSQAALRTKMALKLAGLMTFVASSCPDIKADYARFKTAITALGVTYEDLSKTEVKNVYLAYAMRYKDEAKENCARALVNFGPGGKAVPDIFAATTK